MRTTLGKLALLVALAMTCAQTVAQQSYSQLIGSSPIGEVSSTDPLEAKYILWGGDYGFFHANGGLSTKDGSIYDDLGLNINFTSGDDPIQAIKDYRSGKTPFIRMTYRMASLFSDSLNDDPRIKPRLLIAMTYSQGDHIVTRNPKIKTISDIIGTSGILQRGGPHEGLIWDTLQAARVEDPPGSGNMRPGNWSDIDITWVDDIMGDMGPAAAFRTNSNADWVCVVTPEMFGLTGGLQNTGNGAEGTVRGGRVVVSTAEFSRSILDGVFVRSDFLNDNYELCQDFARGYLRSCEEIIDMRKEYQSRGSKSYLALMQMAQDIYGEENLPTLEEDAHGLLLDCTFLGYNGQVAFMNEPNNPNGIGSYNNRSRQMVEVRGIVNNWQDFRSASLDYSSDAFLTYLNKTNVQRTARFNAEAVADDIEALNTGQLNQRTVETFVIYFDPDQTEFPIEQYEDTFQRVIDTAAGFGNAAIVVRGHSDPTRTLFDMIIAGINNGNITTRGQGAGTKYFMGGRPLDLTDTNKIIELIDRGSFRAWTGPHPRTGDTEEFNPVLRMQRANGLALERAENVIDTIRNMARDRNMIFDESQLYAQSVGIGEPVVAKPRNPAQAGENMRVEFRIVRVNAEAMEASDFDF